MQQSTTPRKPASTRVLAPAEITPLSEINNVTGPTGEQRECSMCRTDRRICDGGRPCARCVTYGFQCRDVRKRGRPKKDQEDKSLAVQEHPLFSEWSLGGAAKPQEGPRKKRRGSRSGGSGSAAAVVNKSGRHTSAASLRPGETLPISKKNLDTVLRASPITAGNSSTTTQRKDDTGGPVPERQADGSYPASTDSSNAASSASYRPAYSSVYPYYALDRDPNYLRQQNSSSKESAFKPSAEQTSKGLEAELQRYREQYRMLYASEASKQQRGQHSDFPSASSSPQQQQQQQQRDFPGFRVGQDNTVFTPFYNTLQELMRHGDGKPSSVVMREEVVCIDSVQTPPSSNNKNNNTANEQSKDVANKTRPPESSFMETEPTSSHMGSYQPSSSSFNYRYPPSSLYSSSYPKPQSESQDQSTYRRPYYPYATPAIPNFGSRSDPGVRVSIPSSYNPYEDRRSAWDFSSSSPKLASQLSSMDRPPFPPFNPSTSSSPSSSATPSSSTSSTPPSVPPPNSSLLRLLASYDS